MAQDAVTGLAGGRHNSVLNFRVDDQIQAGVQAFADANGVSKSEACRLLLGASLGDTAKQAAAREAIFRFAAVRRRFLAKLMTAFSASIPAALEDAEGEVEGASVS